VNAEPVISRIQLANMDLNIGKRFKYFCKVRRKIETTSYKKKAFRPFSFSM